MSFLSGIGDALGAAVNPFWSASSAAANGAGGILSGLGGSSNPSNLTTTNLPWNSSYLTTLMQQAKDLYGNTNPNAATYATNAGTGLGTLSSNPLVTQGQNQLTSAAGNLSTQAQAGTQNLGGYLNYLINQGTNPNSSNVGQVASHVNPTQAIHDMLNAPNTPNPYLPGIIQAVTDNLTKNLNQNILPGINESAIANNTYGGSRQGIAQANAITGTQQEIGNQTANLAYQDYLQRLGQQTTGANLATNVLNSADAQNIAQQQLGLSSGNLGSGLLSSTINSSPILQSYPITTYNAEATGANNLTQFPWTNFNNYANLLLQSGGLGSTQTQPGPAQASTASTLLGAGLTGLGTYGALQKTPLAGYAMPISLGVAGLSAFA